MMEQENKMNKTITQEYELIYYRNLKDTPFPFKLDTENGRGISKKIQEIFVNHEILGFKKINLWQESKEKLFLLLERGLITNKLYKNREVASLLIKDDESLIVMINEENHIKVVARRGKKTFKYVEAKGKEILEILENNLELAYDERLGYLTTSVNNIGTALRVSVIIHLPMLTIGHRLDEIVQRLEKQKIILEDIYKEDNKGLSNIYVLSNKVTLGMTDKEIMNDIEAISHKLMIQEKKEREILLETDEEGTFDTIFRALGILKNARKIKYSELINLLSMVRMGVELGIIKDITLDNIDKLLIEGQYNHVKEIVGTKINENRESIIRATMVRETFNS
ncbi:MAG: hypothetical protein ACRCX8_16425 [Sarcina sp.]